MWTYKFDTGILTTCTPIADGSISRRLIDGEIFDRFQVDGSFTFYDDDYAFIINERDVVGSRTVEFQILQDGDLQVTCILDLFGTENETLEQITLQVVDILDDYRLILKGLNTELNIIDSVDKYTFKTSTYALPLEFSLSAFSSPAIGSLWGTVTESLNSTTVNVYARQTYTTQNTAELNVFIDNGWTQVGATSRVVRDWQGEIPTFVQANHISIEKASRTAPPSVPPASETYAINDQKPESSKLISKKQFIFLAGLTAGGRYFYWNYFLDNDAYYGESEVFYPNAYKFIDVIKWMIGEIDSSLTFDNTGTSTDSFYYFKNTINLGQIIIQGLTDTLLTSSGTVKTIPSTVLNITLNKVFEFLKNRFSIFWYIDGSGVFRFVHLTAWYTKTATSSSHHNTTNFMSVDWSNQLDNVEFDFSKQYDRIKRNELAYTIDFIGTDITFPDVEQTNLLEISNNTFFVDLQDIYRRPGRYNSESINQAILAVTESNPSFDLLYGWINDNTNSFDTLDSVAIAAGEEIPAIDLISLSDAAGSAYLISEIFAGSKGATITFNLTHTSVSGTANYTMYIGYLSDDSSLSFATNFQPLSFQSVTADSANVLTYVLTKSYANLRVAISDNSGVSVTSDFTSMSVTNNRLIKLIENTGSLSGTLKVPNADLSIANTDNRDFAQGSDTAANINGSSKTLSANEVLRFKSQQGIKMPSMDIEDDWTFGEYVTTNITTTGVLQDVTIPLRSDFAEIKIKL